jgi:hypothetical protein
LATSITPVNGCGPDGFQESTNLPSRPTPLTLPNEVESMLLQVWLRRTACLVKELFVSFTMQMLSNKLLPSYLTVQLNILNMSLEMWHMLEIADYGLYMNVALVHGLRLESPGFGR